MRRRRSGPAALAPAVVVAAALGTGAGYLLSGSGDEPVAPVEGPLTVRAAVLATPAGWRTEFASTEIPGFPPGDTLAQRRGAATVMLSEVPEGPFLLPDALRPQVAEDGIARAGSLGATRWRLTSEPPGQATEILAVASTTATVVLGCRARTAADARATCLRALRDLRIRSGAPIRPDLAAPVARALVPVLPAYNRTSTAVRRALAAARTDRARARAAERAAAPASDARERLVLSVGTNPAARPVIRAFGELARAYDALRRGYARGSYPAKARGVAAVRAAERRLEAEVARLGRLLEPLDPGES